MIIARNQAELENALDKFHGQQVAFVPTMGALHAGHLSLIEIAKQNAAVVAVSIFVNPLQFGAGEDFDKYPRTFESDAALLQENDVDILFAPDSSVIYPQGKVVTQRASKTGELFEGAARPGHFDGMLTVVARLFELVKPDFAIFGQKDAQQLALVRELAAENQFGGKTVQVIAGPTQRADSGLALSSRNRYLSQAELDIAATIPRALAAASKSESVIAALDAARAQLNPKAKLEYLELVDAGFRPVARDFLGQCLMIIACRVGSTRLIDNQPVIIERPA